MTKKQKVTEETQATDLVIETLPPISFDITAQGLARLKKESAIFNTLPETVADYQKLTKQIAKVRTTRTSIEARRKEANAPVLEWQRLLNSKAKELTEALQEIEQPLVDLKAKADEEKARKKAEQEAQERARLQELNDRLTELKAIVFTVNTPEEAGQAIDDLQALEITKEDYQELTDLAEVARQETLMKLRQRVAQMEADRIAEEDRQRELAELESKKEAQAKLEAEQAERQAQLDAQEAELKARAQALEDQEAARLAEQAEKEAAERAAQEAAEREKAEKEAQAKLAAEAKKQAQAQAKWKKAILADLPALEAYLANLAEVSVPHDQVKTAEAKALLGNIDLAIAEAQLEAATLADKAGGK